MERSHNLPGKTYSKLSKFALVLQNNTIIGYNSIQMHINGSRLNYINDTELKISDHKSLKYQYKQEMSSKRRLVVD